MKNKILTPLYLVLAAVILLTGSCSKDKNNSNVKPNIVFYGLSSSNQLLKYNANAVNTIIAQVAITGLQASESLLAIDFRPATGQLYGLGNSSRLYIINTSTGVATPIGTAPFSPAINGTITGFDFNATVDRIRVVTNLGQNFRLNPETGAVAATDTDINPPASVSGVAYSNNYAGAGITTLYAIDGVKFYRQNPNAGTLTVIDSLGIIGTAAADFDISPDNKLILAPITVSGMNNLYQIDSTTGKATNLGTFATPVIGIAIPTNPVAYSIDNITNNLLVFNFTSPGTPVAKAISGLQASETILGIDIRPATGQLYALGSTSRIYTVSMSTGAATEVGVIPFVPLLSGTSFGFDFNPQVDRIRIVSNTGQNIRINPTNGIIAGVDTDLSPGTPTVTAAAYTNNYVGATSTTLYVIDHTTDKLYIQNPPNNGILAEVGSLGIDVTSENGFDIGGATNTAYALLTVAGTTKIYTINLTSGAATAIATYPGQARAFCVGTGF